MARPARRIDRDPHASIAAPGNPGARASYADFPTTKDIMPSPDASLAAAFEQAVAQSKTLPERPDNLTLLKMYALFKQASEGDVTDEKPGAMDFVAVAKWNAREELRGVASDEAMRRYIDLIKDLAG